MNNKINLLFDATILISNFKKDNHRSGVFFTAFNILKEFDKTQKFNITLYFHCYHKKYLSLIKKDKLYSKFKYIFYYDYSVYEQYLNNISVHSKYIKSKDIFIFKKTIRFLRILLNYYRISKYKYYKNRYFINLLNSLNIYFTSDCFIPDKIKNNDKIKKYIFLHDITPIIYSDYFPGFFKTNNILNEYIELKNLKKNNYYFCNSNNTKKDYLKYYNTVIDENNIFVTYISSAQIFIPNYNKEKLLNVFNNYNVEYDTNKKYIFSLCTLEPRKNLLFTIKCFIKFIEKHKLQDIYFYLGGGHWEYFISKLEEQIENLNKYSSKVVKLGYIDDEDINILYSNSLFFTYLSQYEGFGMPVLEAMQAGTPVITSNNSSLPEVVGDSAITIDYNNEEQCIKVFEDLYFNENLRKEYIHKGLERAKLFSWEKTVKIMTDVMVK